MSEYFNLSEEFIRFFDSYEWKDYLWKLSPLTGDKDGHK